MLSIFLDHSVNVSCFSHSVLILSAVRLSVFSASLLHCFCLQLQWLQSLFNLSVLIMMCLGFMIKSDLSELLIKNMIGRE